MFSVQPEQSGLAASVGDGGDRIWESFGVVGFNFRTVCLDTRGRLCFAEQGLRSTLRALREQGIQEAVVLCTCNRTEIYFWSSDPGPVYAAISEQSEVAREKLVALSYRREGAEGVKHLFRVCSGMESAALGETEILCQVKEAFSLSEDCRMAGSRLSSLFQRAMRVSKRVRTDSGICREVTSIAGMAVKRAGELTGRSVLVIGAGHMAERIAREIERKNPAEVVIVNRTPGRASTLAATFDFRSAPWEELDSALNRSDVVFSAISAEFPVVDEVRLARLDIHKERLFVDLCVPASVESVPAEQFIDMDEISRNCDLNSQSRMDALPAAEAIVEQEWDQFEQEILEREAAPHIKKLAEYAEEVRSRNLAWARSQMKDPSPAELKLLEDLSIRLVRGMLEGPINVLKKELRDPVERAVVARLFDAQRNPS